MAATDPAGAQKRQIDETDERILWELRRDADLTNAALAARVGLSPSAAHARVRALRAAGVLGASHADVDLAALGLPLQAIVGVRLRAQARPAIKTYAAKVAQLPNVLNIYFLGGQTDFLIHVVTTSPEQLRDFVATRLSMDPAVASTETQIVFDWVRSPGRAGGFDDMRDSIS
ncbi:Lrp/AsnC family transcriptional regulator [Microbacterium sp. 18062]|uniref:Lrp/AsnC family transcriptional regulator n=1 Tax=Microbacterium sp. 18062 TaxID=2681410 RepID=UPI00135A7EE2|nr:Lrp/AsnC family transcriptional regulator [Microbacterium sp. 18062]